MSKVTEIIKQLQDILQEHGDLEFFTSSGYPLNKMEPSKSEDWNFPADYNMPEKFVLVDVDD